MSDIIPSLIAKHHLISDQVNKAQVETILRELQKVLEKEVEGAVVEFGCYIGTTSLPIRRYLDAYTADCHFDRSHRRSGEIPPAEASTKTSEQTRSTSPRAFHVYDSFEGLPPKSTQDASVTGEQFTAGALAVSKKQFLHEFHKAGLQPPIIHKGWFGDLSEQDIPAQIAFAFLDGDFYESIRDSLRLVLPHMQKGSTIVIDDYAREALPGAAKAVHEYFSPSTVTVAHNLGIIHL
jgi:O-methyltransferase